MKDYYSRLDLPATATKREIEAELPALDDTVMRRNARFVLLDPERRVVYDQCHRALRQIAFLRANLGLNRTPFWRLSDCDDFTTEPFSRLRHSARRSLTKPLLSILVVLLAALALVELFTPEPLFEVEKTVRETSTEEPIRVEFIEPEREPNSAQPAASWKDWQAAFQSEIAPVRKAWRDLTSGLDQRSFELAESQCRRLQRAVRSCDQDKLLPSPDLELDGAVAGVLEHLAGAAQTCRSQRYFEMTEELDRAQEGWDRIERMLRYQALEPR